MCSIGGWIASSPLHPQTTRKLAAALLWYGMPRGEQSSGVWLDGRLLRAAKSPRELIYEDAFLNLIGDGARMCLTHTRQPTSGGRGDTDAQPFVKGPATTIHNGCISNCAELKKKFKVEKEGTEVDSAIITAIVAEHGPEALPDFVKEMRGSAATVVTVGQEMWAIRDCNPLEYLTISLTNGTTVSVFASTEPQLLDALHSVWMLEPATRSITVPHRVLCKITPTGFEQVGKPLPPAYNYGGVNYGTDWRGNGGHFTGRRGGHENRQGDRRTDSSGSPSQQGAGSTPVRKVIEPSS